MPSDSIAATRSNSPYQARAILDQLGRQEVKIFASGDLEEFEIARLVRNEAPIDAFGVGTELITSKDAPALSLVYKLVELNGVGKIKLSPSKRTYPMAKQVFRNRDAAGRFAGDHVTRADEDADGAPLLVPVVREGKLVAATQTRRDPGSLPRPARVPARSAPWDRGRAGLLDFLQRRP